MSIFRRQFDIDKLVAWIGSNPGSILSTLFEHWALPGVDAKSHGLRIGIRDGYLNLYRKGQSVAELRMAHDGPRVRTHSKYVFLPNQTESVGKEYITFGPDFLSSQDSQLAEQWISTGEDFSGDEKRFVDDLISATPGTIDLEMALPADKTQDSHDRSAPRMDLVVTQDNAIAFWEAKCAINGELRANCAYEEQKGKYIRGPHILWQLRRYQTWVEKESRRLQVRVAYVQTAKILLKLAEALGRNGPALEAWGCLAAAGETAEVILPPGIVIANYCPSSRVPKLRSKVAIYEGAARSFVENDHEGRLKRHNATIVSVAAKPTAGVLARLISGSLSEIETLPGAER